MRLILTLRHVFSRRFGEIARDAAGAEGRPQTAAAQRQFGGANDRCDERPASADANVLNCSQAYGTGRSGWCRAITKTAPGDHKHTRNTDARGPASAHPKRSRCISRRSRVLAPAGEARVWGAGNPADFADFFTFQLFKPPVDQASTACRT